MTWTLRHAGSIRTTPGLSSAAILAGLRDGVYGGLDEIRAGGETRFTAVEHHPEFADAVMDDDLLPAKTHDEPTHLDMNPLIDVCLVLLIFFILTASYEQLRKVLDLPGVTNRVAGAAVISSQRAKETTIAASVTLVNGKAVTKVEGDAVAPDRVRDRLAALTSATKKSELLLEVGPGVTWGQVVEVMDAARGAGIQKTLFKKDAPATP